MRQIKSFQELAELQAAGEGCIVNARSDRIKLHWAGCHAIEGMYTPKFPKFFFEGFAEAQEWLNSKYGTKWDGCGYCYSKISK